MVVAEALLYLVVGATHRPVVVKMDRVVPVVAPAAVVETPVETASGGWVVPLTTRKEAPQVRQAVWNNFQLIS
jgi:hypothetical protein